MGKAPAGGDSEGMISGLRRPCQATNYSGSSLESQLGRDGGGDSWISLCVAAGACTRRCGLFVDLKNGCPDSLITPLF